jgi:hypothetical protein
VISPVPEPQFATCFCHSVGIIFSVLFVVALLVSRVVNTGGDPGEIAGLFEDADLYDFVYDRLLDAALNDMTSKGFNVETGLTGVETLQFEDPAQAQLAIKSFIETVLSGNMSGQRSNRRLMALLRMSPAGEMALNST